METAKASIASPVAIINNSNIAFSRIKKTQKGVSLRDLTALNQ
jgi:hypothetical protein